MTTKFWTKLNDYINDCCTQICAFSSRLYFYIAWLLVILSALTTTIPNWQGLPIDSFWSPAFKLTPIALALDVILRRFRAISFYISCACSKSPLIFISITRHRVYNAQRTKKGLALWQLCNLQFRPVRIFFFTLILFAGFVCVKVISVV